MPSALAVETGEQITSTAGPTKASRASAGLAFTLYQQRDR